MEYLLAHDVGTSGCKAVLMGTDGQVVATARKAYETNFSKSLWAEQDPNDWWDALATTTRAVLEQSSVTPDQVLSLSFSTQMVNIIPVDREGKPLRPCINWLDGRAWEEAKAATAKFGGPRLFTALFGATITGKDLIPKYLWLKKHEPDVYRRSAAFVDVSGYLVQHATGKLIYEWTSASVTGLFDFKAKSWDSTALRVFGLEREKFPELVQPTQQVGGLTAVAARELGLLEGTPVFAGAGDVLSGEVGSGAVGEGDGHIYLGTSGFVGIVTSRWMKGRQGVYFLQSPDPQKYLMLAETETAGACLVWAAKELYGREPDAETMAMMDAEVEKTAAGSGNLLFTPWMYGERCPVPDESVRASFINLSCDISRRQMTRAIYEGIAYNLRWMMDLIYDLNGLRPDSMRVMGGGAKGLPWLQIISDVTGRTLETVPHLQSASAVGAGLLAAVGLGLYPSVEATKGLIPVAQVIRPDASSKGVYDNLYAAYRTIYGSLKNLHKRLNQAKTGEA